MKHLLTLLNYRYSLLFIAPPGWGKTRMLLNLISESDKKWVFISPLRALANEFYSATNEVINKTYLIQSKKDFKLFINQNTEYKLLIVTPEVFELSQIKDSIFVWDEFHLTYYWGDSFRDCLMELYYQIASQQRPLLQLSATMSDVNLERWKSECELNYIHYLCINIANQCLKNNPKHYFYYPKLFQNLFYENLELDVLTKKEGVTLLFCQYRSQVDQLVTYFQKLNIKVLSCKGGETKDFGSRLNAMKNVQLIIATTAISHGVNLPPVYRVYFSYAVKNRDFWIQMVGRGGRKGESFCVHTMDFEPECGKKWIAIIKTLFKFIKLKCTRILWLLKGL